MTAGTAGMYWLAWLAAGTAEMSNVLSGRNGTTGMAAETAGMAAETAGMAAGTAGTKTKEMKKKERA